MKNVILAGAVVGVLGMGWAVGVVGGQELVLRRPMPGGGGAGVAEGDVDDKRIAQSPVVLVAKLDSSKALMQTMMMPPTYSFQLNVSEVSALRGTKPEEGVFRYSTRDKGSVPADGSPVILLVSSEEKQVFVTGIVKADEKKIAAVKELLAMPVGWEKGKDGWVSPWAGVHDTKWPAGLVEKGAKACVRTGHPAAALPEAVEFSVEQVPAENTIKWKNDYGDGVFKLTLKNTGKESVTIPSLLKSGDVILWNKSIVVMQGDKTILPADAGNIPADAKPVTLAAGESVSGNFNTLALEGIAWPRGGSRVHFLFALQDRVQPGFFYYFSDLHDAMLEKAKGSK